MFMYYLIMEIYLNLYSELCEYQYKAYTNIYGLYRLLYHNVLKCSKTFLCYVIKLVQCRWLPVLHCRPFVFRNIPHCFFEGFEYSSASRWVLDTPAFEELIEFGLANRIIFDTDCISKNTKCVHLSEVHDEELICCNKKRH